MSTTAATPRRRLFGGFTGAEARLVFGSGAAYGLRMLGTYLALPVLSPYAAKLPGATPLWIGLSVGAYGLTQAIFQVPLGVFGDRHGRGKTLAAGLLIFALGSWICARAGTAPVLVLGRLVQGAGAMAATMIALLGDRTREEVRTRAMAAMGIFIGGAFAIGLVLGPTLSSHVGVPWLFGFATIASLVGLGILPWALRAHTGVDGAHPGDGTSQPPRPTFADAMRTLGNPGLLALDAGIMALHLCTTSLFVVLPLRLAHYVRPVDQWRIYAPVLVAGLLAMGVGSRAAERPGGRRIVLAFGSACVAISCILMAVEHGERGLAAATAVFIIGFACLEPLLAAQVTRQADATLRGTAAGVFNTVQFIGVFLGGLVAGAALGRGEPVLFAGLAVAQVTWVTLAWRALWGKRARAAA